MYVDARINGQQGQRVSQHANGLCLAYGVAPQERWKRIIAYITDPQRVQVTPTGMGLEPPGSLPEFDESYNVVLAHPFFMHHVHRGLVPADRLDLMLANIRERWGAMLAAGATTIWEMWFGFASQCHGWAGTPTFDLSSNILGVMPIANGFERTLVAPQPVDLELARGKCPTPKGEIEVVWERDGDEFCLDVTAPDAIALDIALTTRAATVEVNEQTVWFNDAFHSNTAGVTSVEASPEGLRLLCPCGGTYHILAA